MAEVTTKDQPDWTTAANPVPTLLATIALTASTPVNQTITVPSFIRSLVALSDKSLNWMLVMGNVSTISYLGGDRRRQHIVGPFVGPPDTAVVVSGTPAATGTLWILGVPADAYPNSSDSLPSLQAMLFNGMGEYSVDGTSGPATGSQASVVLAASPGNTYTAAYLDATHTQTATTAQVAVAQLLDGGSAISTRQMTEPAAANNQATFTAPNCAFPGTSGNSMTWQFSAAGTTIAQRVTIGAYLG